MLGLVSTSDIVTQADMLIALYGELSVPFTIWTYQVRCAQFKHQICCVVEHVSCMHIGSCDTCMGCSCSETAVLRAPSNCMAAL